MEQSRGTLQGRWAVLTSITIVAVSVLLSSCNGDPDQDSARAVVTVYAASSLTDIMQQVKTEFEHSNPEVDVRVNLAGSNTLVRQLNNGATADLFLAADVSVLDHLIDGPVKEPTKLASNSLTMIVPEANTAGVKMPSDLTEAGLLTARCATGVPCGNATDQYLDESGLMLGRSTDEPNVRSVLAKVSADEVDAGFVYRSDLYAADNVIEVPLDDPPRVTVALAQLRRGQAVDDLAALIRSETIKQRLTELRFVPAADSGEQ